MERGISRDEENSSIMKPRFVKEKKIITFLNIPFLLKAATFAQLNIEAVSWVF